MFDGQFGRMGPDTVVASTTTINITTDFFRISGTNNIATIVPFPGLQFPTIIAVVPTDGTVNTVTTGNIAKALAMAQNQLVILAWSPVNGKWYPGAIS